MKRKIRKKPKTHLIQYFRYSKTPISYCDKLIHISLQGNQHDGEELPSHQCEGPFHRATNDDPTNEDNK